jgi:hypothetical protein
MTPRDSDAQLELHLRTTLRSLRPADGAPGGLRSRVDLIPDASEPQGLLRRFVGGSPAALAVAGLAGAAAIALLIVGLQPGLLEPAINGAPQPTRIPFDPAVEGPGLLIDAATPTLLVVPGAIVLIALALTAAQLYRHRGIRGWLDVLRLAGLGIVVAGAIGLAMHPGFEYRGGSLAPVLGYGVQADPPRGGDGAPVFYETVNAGDPAILLVTITNPGPLPIRLDGIVKDPGASGTNLPRWTAMTTATDPNVIGQPFKDLGTFQPTTVEPGGYLDVYLVSKAGPCAFGPSFTLAKSADLSMIIRNRQVFFGYSVLGLSSSAPYELPVNLAEPQKVGCPA